MEIVKAFEHNELSIQINIQGSHEEPLFRASDVGEVLEISNIRMSIKDFDNSEKHGVSTTDIIGRNQETTFLTEKGLYKVLFKSRKPIANKFQNWVCEVIKEIRLNGSYELKKQLEEKKQQLEEKDQQLAVQDEKLENFSKEISKTKEKTLLETYGNSKGVYLGLVEENVVKFGHGNIKDRVSKHKTEIGPQFSLEYVIETQFDRQLEKLIKDKYENKIIKRTFPNRKSACTELIQLDNTLTFKKLYSEILKLNEDIKNGISVENQQEEINELNEEISELKETHSKEIIKLKEEINILKEKNEKLEETHRKEINLLKEENAVRKESKKITITDKKKESNTESRRYFLMFLENYTKDKQGLTTVIGDEFFNEYLEFIKTIPKYNRLCIDTNQAFYLKILECPYIVNSRYTLDRNHENYVKGQDNRIKCKKIDIDLLKQWVFEQLRLLLIFS